LIRGGQYNGNTKKLENMVEYILDCIQSSNRSNEEMQAQERYIPAVDNWRNWNNKIQSIAEEMKKFIKNEIK
jgi:hypothetical protein